MLYPSEAVEKAISQLSQLPGIGRKSAQRIVFYLLKVPAEEVRLLAESLLRIKERVTRCSICCSITEQDPCAICTDPKRDQKVICVVEEANDVLAAQFAQEFYDRFFGTGAFAGRPQPLGQAFHEARMAIRAADPANPTWLAYVLYGDPYGQVVLGDGS